MDIYGTKVESEDKVTILIPLNPYTKKNSSRVLYKNTPSGDRIPFISPSAQYKQYEHECLMFLRALEIDYPVNVEAHFYMETRRHVDLTNLNEALHDILVRGHVLKDDNASILVSTDGSRVYYDKENPRTEVIITRTEGTFLLKEKEKKKKKSST